MKWGLLVKLLKLRPLGLSVIALMAMASAAQALDAADFAGKVISIYATSMAPGEKVTFGPATVTGNDITYDGLTLTTPGADPVKLATKLKFVGVAEAADGSYTADALTFPDVDQTMEKTEITVKNITLKHLFVPNGKAPSIIDGSRVFRDASVGPISVVVDGKPVVSIDSISISNTLKPSQTDPALAEIDSAGTTSGLKVDMTGAKDQESLDQIKALGLQTVTGKSLEAMTWTLKDGHLNISEVSIDLDQIGKLKFGLEMTGYTPEFLQNLTTVSQAMVAGQSGGNSADQSKNTALLLGAAQTLFLNSMSLRFDDATITGRVLDYLAKKQGVSKQALIDQYVAALPAAMNDGSEMPPDLTHAMQAAVQKFLADPHSIEIKLAPKTPLGVLGIVGAAMAPANLADTIGLQLVVNDKQVTAADYVAPPVDTTAPQPADDTAAPADDTAAPADGSTAPADDTAAPATDATPAPAEESTGKNSDKLTSKHLH